MGKVAAAALKNANLTLSPKLNKINENSDDSCVRVMITDEAGRTVVDSEFIFCVEFVTF